jgi:hypothetical protein
MRTSARGSVAAVQTRYRAERQVAVVNSRVKRSGQRGAGSRWRCSLEAAGNSGEAEKLVAADRVHSSARGVAEVAVRPE